MRNCKYILCLIVDFKSQICQLQVRNHKFDLSVIYAGILHEDHGFLPIVGTILILNDFLLDTTTFTKKLLLVILQS